MPTIMCIASAKTRLILLCLMLIFGTAKIPSMLPASVPFHGLLALMDRAGVFVIIGMADKKVEDLNATLAESDVPADGLLIQKGKKNFRRLFLA